MEHSGCGPLGLLIMAVARAYNVRRIIAFDVEQSRVDFATSYNADVGILSPFNTDGQEPLAFATDFMTKVIKEQGLGSGVDLVIEASGAEACTQMAVVLAKPGGTSTYFGDERVVRVFADFEVVIQAGLGRPLSSVPLFLFTAKELNMKGISTPPLPPFPLHPIFKSLEIERRED